MKALLGYKVGMTQIIEEDGRAVPATVLHAGPCFVTQVKTNNHDGYEALQIGFDETEEKRLTRGELGHLGRLETDETHPQRKRDRGIPALRHLREVRTKTIGEYEVGQQLTVEQFEKGEHVDVTGKSKGRGFTGVVKRHGFRGGPKTHGQSDRWRAPGSIGATSGMARVIKGMRMAGRSGNETVTAQNLEVVRIDSERNLIAVKGSVPGAKGGLVLIRNAQKE
ncbi:MAG: 50S ribosomal protein L3 [Chloroflexota bacterium]